MERLTDQALPLKEGTFKKCQLCGYEDSDICEFRFWNECDEHDQKEPYNILITCKKDECFQRIEEHERLYIQLAWSSGDPGHFSLLCGDCPHRDGFRCTHPNLKANGGSGLTLMMANDAVYRATVCYHTDENEYGLTCRRPTPPMTRCAGLPEGHSRHCAQELPDDSPK
jgi:hypothetical protein